MTESTLSWRGSIRLYTRRNSLALFGLGLSAGLPFLLVFTTLTAWLAESGIDKSTIGFFSWIGLTYSIKVFWAPVVDHIRLPGLGWLDLGTATALAQLVCILVLVVLGARVGWVIKHSWWLPVAGALFAGSVGFGLAAMKYAIH